MIGWIKGIIRPILPKNEFALNVSILVGGTAGAQVLLVLASPILTRLYSPEDFGLLAVYASLLSLISVIASLSYELAIPLPEDDQEAANIVVLCVIILVSISILAALVIIYFGTVIANELGVPVLARHLWLLPIGILLGGAYTIFHYWSIRARRINTIAKTKLQQALATLVIQFSLFKLGGLALLLAQAVGQGAGSIRLAKPALAAPEYRQVKLAGMASAAKRYRRFPIFTTWAGLINAAGHQLPPLLFSSLFSVATAGFYSLAQRTLMLPATVLGSAVGNVFLSQAAEAYRKNELGNLFVNVQDKLIRIGLPPALIIVIAGADLFELIFGEAWRPAGEFAQWLMLGAFAGFVASPLSVVFAIIEKQQVGLLLQTLLFIGRTMGILAGIVLSDMTIAVVLFSLASLFGYLLYLIVGGLYVGAALCNLVYSTLAAGLFALVSILPILLFVVFTPGEFSLLSVLLCLPIMAFGYQRLLADPRS